MNESSSPAAVFDVVVVGAGPVGSYTAYRCAKLGYRVALLEEHAVVGKPRHCTGVLGQEAFDRFPDLPREPIQAVLKAAWIVGPSGDRVRVSWYQNQAYVIQRTDFDQALCQRATDAGAFLRTSARVEQLSVSADNAVLRISSPETGKTETIKTRTVVLACGVSYRLHVQAGLEVPARLLHCAQTEVASDLIKDVEVYVGHHIAPGSFAWTVPIGNGRVRVGVTAHRNAALHLDRLLETLIVQQGIVRAGEPIVRRPVPIRPSTRTAAARVLAVGDAAGQVKPTTGGGIYYGLIGADAASQTLHEALQANDFSREFMMTYDRRWRKALSGEILAGRVGRRIFESLADKRLDRLVRVCAQQPVADLVERVADFDWHGRALFSFLTSPRVLSALL